MADTRRENNLSGFLIYPLLVGALALGIYFCFVGRSGVHLFGDEFHSVWNLNKSYTELLTVYDNFGSGIALPLLQRLIGDVFGRGLWTYRFPAVLGALGTILLMYPAGVRLVGRAPAALATLALSSNAMHIFYSRFGRAYALMIFLGLLLVYVLNRALDQDKPRRRYYFLAAGCGGLCPYVHLAAVPFVVAVWLAAIVTMLVRRQGRKHYFWLLGSLAVGAMICVGLYLPAWDSLCRYVGNVKGKGFFAYFSVLDVAVLLGGSRTAGLVWLMGIPAAVICFLIKYRSGALMIVAAVLAPVVSLVVVQPLGMTYAYARYLLIGLPFMLMLLAWLLMELLRLTRLPERVTEYATVAIGVVLVLVSFWQGPLGLKHAKDGPFANTYISMMPLPAFDVPYDQTPAFYRQLADCSEPVRIIEAPELLSRSVQLYRNYYLQHGKEVSIGIVAVEPERIPAGPYVSVRDWISIRRSGADYFILHLNVKQEVASYWRFVYKKVWPRMRDPDIDSLMLRQLSYMEPLSSLRELVEYLRRGLGEPVYRDPKIVVWKLKS